jgi:hypothetical protein
LSSSRGFQRPSLVVQVASEPSAPFPEGTPNPEAPFDLKRDPKKRRKGRGEQCWTVHCSMFPFGVSACVNGVLSWPARALFDQTLATFPSPETPRRPSRALAEPRRHAFAGRKQGHLSGRPHGEVSRTHCQGTLYYILLPRLHQDR